ncbi:hypothetical protein [Streptomyces sp. NRRL F-2747]|uniref:hypothetical protein n=1 Tax=Streptomyces sp. NRRL F-2747 TaxID=1463843 RepID=UPI0004C7F48D|nr:hypothetical protein [Streptomyces sp. NRRL F-2747]
MLLLVGGFGTYMAFLQPAFGIALLIGISVMTLLPCCSSSARRGNHVPGQRSPAKMRGFRAPRRTVQDVHERDHGRSGDLELVRATPSLL